MATQWCDHYAQCPYYKSTDSKRQLTCQGVADSSVLTWKFQSKADMMIQVKTFCCDKYGYCEVYQMLRKIYEED